MNQIKIYLTKISKYKYLLILLSIYITTFIYINPIKQPKYIVGDEWSSFRQIEAFQKGIFRLNGAKDTAFILQGILGYASTFIIEDNFLAIRTLNFLVSILFCVGTFLLSKSLTKDDKKSFLVSTLVIFNPLVYFLSFTFYSELYLLALLVWAIYFFNLYFSIDNLKQKILYLIIGSTLSGAAILVRQQAIIFSILFFLIAFLKDFKNITNLKKLFTKQIFIYSFIILTFILIYGLWPVYIDWNREYLFSGFVKLMNKKTSEFRLNDYIPYLFSIFYLAFFSFPLLQKTKLNVFTFLSGLIFSNVAFVYGNFAIGDMFSLGGYFVKDINQAPTSLFNNLIFKILISITQGFGTIYIFYIFKNVISNLKKLSNTQVLLLSAAIFYFISNFYIADVYDRYIVVPMVLLILFFSTSYFDFTLNFYKKFLLVFIVLMSVLYLYEFVQTRQLSYKLGFENPQKMSKLSKILLTEEFGKYTKSIESKDYTGLIYPRPENQFECEIMKIYFNTINEDNKIFGYPIKKLIYIPDHNVKDIYKLVESIKITEPSNFIFGFYEEINIYCKK